MSYTRPDGDAASFQFAGAYTRPDGDAANFEFPGDIVSGSGAVTIGPLTAEGLAGHGVAGSGAVTLPELTAAGIALTEGDAVEGSGAVTIGPLTAVGVAGHGVAGSGAVTIGALFASGVAAHGVAGAASVIIGPISASGVASHPRYHLKGEVRDGGILVNRTVRAYRRDTGAMVGEAATSAGRFDIHAGFEAREHYVVPIHLDSAATDYLPPTANRVLSVLAVD